MDKSKAIAIAVSRFEAASGGKWGKGRASAKTQGKGVESTAQWEAMRAKSRAGDVKKEEGFSVTAEISKVDDEQQNVFGWAYVSHDEAGELQVDKSGECIDDPNELEKAAYDFVLESRNGGENHNRDKDDKAIVKSTMIESMVFTPEKIQKMGLDGQVPVGWWTGWHIGDEDTWQGFKDGKYKMFSIHGTGVRKEVGV
jgi:hypothetical protein